jgi:hypothetical protein
VEVMWLIKIEVSTLNIHLGFEFWKYWGSEGIKIQKPLQA